MSVSATCLGSGIVFGSDDFLILGSSGFLSVGLQKEGALFGVRLNAFEKSYTVKEVKLGIFSTKTKIKTSESHADFSVGLCLPEVTLWVFLKAGYRNFFPVPYSTEVGYGIWRGSFLMLSKTSVRIPLATLSVGYKSESFITPVRNRFDRTFYLNAPFLSLRMRLGNDLWYVGTPLKTFDSLGEYGVTIGMGRTDFWSLVLDLDFFKGARINPMLWFNFRDGSIGYSVRLSGRLGYDFTVKISPQEAFLILGW